MSKRGYAASKKLLTGLIGAPIAHSASPAMHERAAEALGLRGHYQLIEVAGADAAGLSLMLEGVRRLGFAGVNVTFPYKEAVVPLLDELAPAAATMAAVNTVVVRDNRLIGHNTDTTGFARAVAPLLAASGNAVAVIGTGGVGKAIAFALASLEVTDLRIFDSEPARAENSPRCWQSMVAHGWLEASRTRLPARPASSTARRWACCRTGTPRCQPRCCAKTCGSPMPSIRR